MRTLCDVCESAAAIFFCAADEAALCRACDHKVHDCNKLASRHIRVGLDAPNAVPNCDICENDPAYFYCETDGSSLCLQCDMAVHVGCKRTHKRYLLLRQRAEFPADISGQSGDGSSQQADQTSGPAMNEREQNHIVPIINGNASTEAQMDATMIDLNARPQSTGRRSQTNQGMDTDPGTPLGLKSE